jgi:hypothetical protein
VSHGNSTENCSKRWHRELKGTWRYLFSNVQRTPLRSRTKQLAVAAQTLQTTEHLKAPLNQSVRDRNELYHASTESEAASAIVVASRGIFCFSLLYFVCRCIEFVLCRECTHAWIRFLDILLWVSIFAVLGAFAAVHHLVRKVHHLVKIGRVISGVASLRMVRTMIRAQQFVTLILLLAGVCVIIALPWGLSISMWSTQVHSVHEVVPIYLSALAALPVILGGIIGVLFEYFIRYHLDPCLGPSAIEPLQEQLDQMKRFFPNPTGVEIETTQTLEKQAWEYTAREFLHEYRFDTVSAVDRFGSILQYLHSGHHHAS